MAWIAGLPTFENVPARTALGLRGLRFPVTGLTEVRKPLRGCTGCPKAALHGPPAEKLGVAIPLGETSSQRIPSGQTATAANLNKLMASLSLLAYVQNGIPFGGLYNLGLGTANNISQQMTLRILSVDGDEVTVTGENPKRYTVGTSRTNPDYPFPDEATGQTGRIVSESKVFAVPVGARVKFEYPSALADKMAPWVVSITPPVTEDLTGTTWVLKLSHTATACMTPYDLGRPPSDGKYYLTLYFYATRPETWPNYQATTEAQWARRSVALTKSELDGVSNLVVLKDSDGEDTRVLPPGVFTNALSVAHTALDGTQTTITPLDSALTTVVVVPGISWTATLNLSAHVTGDTASVVITYWCKAIAGDSPTMPFFGSCALAQVDRSGSYVHGVTRRCMNVACDGFADFQDLCWQPSADKFALGYKGNRYGVDSEYLPDETHDSLPLSYVWNRSSGFIAQGWPGVSSYRNFSYERPAGCGPSIGEILGTFRSELSSGVAASRTPIFSPSLGQRATSSDVDGDHHELRTGAFVSAEPQDMDGSPVLGSLAAVVAGWSMRNKDGLGVTLSSKLAVQPRQRAGSTGLYTFEHGGDARPSFCRLSDIVEEVYVTSISRSDTSSTLEDEIRARFS